MIRRIQHIGIAVRSLQEAIPFYRDVLGLELVGTEEVADQKIRAAVFRVGESTIEVIESTAPDGPVGKFIEKNGEGIHHLCFEVGDAAAALSHAKGKGVRLIDETPRSGVHGMRIGFLHPKSTFGVLTEFAQARGRGTVSMPGPAPSRRSLLLCLHNHQPVGNFDSVIEGAARDAYLPFLQTLADFPSVKVTIHFSGFLLRWLAERSPETFSLLKLLSDRGQAELLGGGMYEPILALLPERDRLGQIEALAAEVKRLFGKAPEGIWLAERVWEPDLPATLEAAGVKYLPVDDYHFVRAGLFARGAGRRLPHRIQRRRRARLPRERAAPVPDSLRGRGGNAAGDRAADLPRRAVPGGDLRRRRRKIRRLARDAPQRLRGRVASPLFQGGRGARRLAHDDDVRGVRLRRAPARNGLPAHLLLRRDGRVDLAAARGRAVRRPAP